MSSSSLVEFDAGSHEYRVDGVLRPSVSQILNTYLGGYNEAAIITTLCKYQNYSKEQALLLCEEKRALGTKMHVCIEKYLLDEPMHAHSSEEIDVVQKVADFLKRKKWKFVAAEKIVHCENFAGTIDAIFHDENGAIVLVDWKRTQKLQKPRKNKDHALGEAQNCTFHRYSLQLALYAHAYTCMTGNVVEKLYVVRVHPNLKKAIGSEAAKLPMAVAEILRKISSSKIT